MESTENKKKNKKYDYDVTNDDIDKDDKEF